MRVRGVVLAVFGLAILASPLLAGTCNTPPVALDDDYDTFGVLFAADVLKNDRDDDGEALDLTVLSETCANHSAQAAQGYLIIQPTGSNAPGPATCTVNYRVTDERGAFDTAVVIVRLQPYFADGFESGSTAAWSATQTVGEGEGEP